MCTNDRWIPASLEAAPLSNGAHTSCCGTPRYMAPEVAYCMQGEQGELAHYDKSCDVYSFGILMWEVMNMQQPFGTLSSYSALLAAMRGDRPPISLEGDRSAFGGIIADCWSHSPSQRPAMTDVIQQLLLIEAGLAGPGVAHQPSSWPHRNSEGDSSKSSTTANHQPQDFTAKLGSEIEHEIILY